MDNKHYLNKIVKTKIDRTFGSKDLKDKDYNVDSIEALVEFQERYFEHTIIK